MFKRAMQNKSYEAMKNAIDGVILEAKEHIEDLISNGIDESLIRYKGIRYNASNKFFDIAENIVKGGGTAAAARFGILKDEPSLSYEGEPLLMEEGCIPVWLTYCMVYASLTGDKMPISKAKELQDYFDSSMAEIAAFGAIGLPFPTHKPIKKQRFLLGKTIILILIVCLSGVIYFYDSKLTDTYSQLQKRTGSRDMFASKYHDTLDQLEMYQDDFAYVTRMGSKYHKLNCYHIENADLFIDTIQELKQSGYEPCSDCYE